jgi:hypothetical protein
VDMMSIRYVDSMLMCRCAGVLWCYVVGVMVLMVLVFMVLVFMVLVFMVFMVLKVLMLSNDVRWCDKTM